MNIDDDVILNKIDIIKRCRSGIREVYEQNPENLADYTKQDSIILNLQRACEACIDMSNHFIAQKDLGVPKTSRDSFEALHSHGYLEKELLVVMKNMVGFRNSAVHNYQKVDIEILKNIVENHLNDFEKFYKNLTI